MSLRPFDDGERERGGGEGRREREIRGRGGMEGKVAEVRPHREVGTEPKAICISHRVF